MYLYVLTYWCQKSMHQKCHIDSQLQRKSIFFFFNYKYWKKLCTEKRAWWLDSAQETNLQSQYGLWGVCKLDLNSYTVLVHWTSNCISTKKTKTKHFPSSLQSSIGCFQSVLTKGCFFKLPETWFIRNGKKKYYLSGKTFYFCRDDLKGVTGRVNGMEDERVLGALCGRPMWASPPPQDH